MALTVNCCMASLPACLPADCLLSVQDLHDAGQQVLQMPSTECEVLYGRCGYIYSLLFASKYVGTTQETAKLLEQLLRQIVEEGRRGAAELRATYPDSKWTLMWSWHGSYYLGGDTSLYLQHCVMLLLNQQHNLCRAAKMLYDVCQGG